MRKPMTVVEMARLGGWARARKLSPARRSRIAARACAERENRRHAAARQLVAAARRLFHEYPSLNVIDPVKHRTFIIERIADKGSLAEISRLFSVFGKSRVLAASLRSRRVSPKTKNFLRIVYAD